MYELCCTVCLKRLTYYIKKSLLSWMYLLLFSQLWDDLRKLTRSSWMIKVNCCLTSCFELYPAKPWADLPIAGFRTRGLWAIICAFISWLFWCSIRLVFMEKNKRTFIAYTTQAHDLFYNPPSRVHIVYRTSFLGAFSLRASSTGIYLIDSISACACYIDLQSSHCVWTFNFNGLMKLTRTRKKKLNLFRWSLTDKSKTNPISPFAIWQVKIKTFNFATLKIKKN